MIFGGAQVGNIVGPYLSGILLADGGHWANVFYLFGTLGIIWFIFWVRYLNKLKILIMKMAILFM